MAPLLSIARGGPVAAPAPCSPTKTAHACRPANIVRRTGAAFLTCVLTLGTAAGAARAQETVDIRFEPGATSTTINGTIRGDEYIDYVVNARGGQTMVVSLAVTGSNGNGSAFFNILPAGQDYGGPYTGSTDDDRRAEITVPSDGDWAIRVYLMGNDRDTDRTVGFSIDVYITPEADGSAPPSSTAANPPIGELRPGDEFDATSIIPCARHAGQPMTQCNAGVVREGGGNGTITVLWPDGGRRVIGFEMDTPSWYDETEADASARMTVEQQSGGLYLVRIGDERFEIVEAMMTGG
jgi:hypothetical protein